MEDEMSVILNASTNVKGEASDSNSCICPSSNSKRRRHDSNDHASRFKGVVVQQNGHWGAQIYANHQRIWLGTFRSEKEAAMAYDSAAMKLRSGESHRNFPWTNITVQEPNFQSQFSTVEVLNMIKDGSYPITFVEYLRVQFKRDEIEIGLNMSQVLGNEGGILCRQLFQKELTPSDVGKLNRLVIPKKCALKYFPHIFDGVEENASGREVDDMQLVFFDRSMRSWKFRYCYWKSSQSFVFTRGWNRFVKEKQLKAKDMVIFYMYECSDRLNKVERSLMIDVGYYDGNMNGNAGTSQLDDLVQDTSMDEDAFFEDGVLAPSDHGENIDLYTDDEKEDEKVARVEAVNKGLRLFGVQII